MNLGRYIGLLALILALYILWQIRQVLLLFFTAVVLATALNQLVRQFQRLGIRRGWSVLLSLNILFVIFIIFIWLVVPSFAKQLQELVTLLPTSFKALQNVVNWLENQLLGTTFPDFTGLDGIIQQLQPIITQVLERSVNLFSSSISVALPMAIVLLDAPWKAGAVLLLYIVIQQIESYWLTPTIMAKQVSLLPALTLTSQIAFASFFGALGLFMALPLTVVAKTWLEEVLIKDVLDKWNYRQPQPDNQ